MHFTVYKSIPVTVADQVLELSERELSMIAGGVGSTHIPAPDRTQEHRPAHPVHPNRPHRPTSPAHPVQHAADLHAGHANH